MAPCIHLSTFERIAQSTEGYARGNVPSNLEVVENTGSTATSKSIQQLMRNELGKTSSLLNRVSWAVNVRIGAHVAMLALLVFIFVMFMIDSSAGWGFWSALVDLFSIYGLIDLLKYTLKHYWWLVVIVIALYMASDLAERYMKSRFSEFYHGLLKRLRKIFDLTSEKV